MVPEPPPGSLRIEMRNTDTCERVMKTSGLFPLMLIPPITLVGKCSTSNLPGIQGWDSYNQSKKCVCAQCQIGKELLFNYPSSQNSLGLVTEEKKKTKRY